MHVLPSPQMTFPIDTAKPTLIDLYKLYEDGKHRRYGMMFSVNGGAFAVATILTDGHRTMVGALRPLELSLSLIFMTEIMVFDIVMFGVKMRAAVSHSDSEMQESVPEVFGTPGRLVLGVLGFLIIMGWCLVGLVP